jgi:hypothetical protein
MVRRARPNRKRKAVGLKQRRAKHADRNFWVALDFHTRTGRNRAKLVAIDWNLKPHEVANIASRFRRRPEFQKILAAKCVAEHRRLLTWHRARLCAA